MRSKPPVVLGFTFALLLATSLAGAQARVDTAPRRFERGQQLFNQRHYDAALSEFRAALALSGSPNARLYVARCLTELARLPEAASEYDQALRESTERAVGSQRYVATRNSATTELRALAPRIGRLRLRVANDPDSLHVTAGGREISSDALRSAFPVAPGRVHVVVTADGHAPTERDIEVAPASEVVLEMILVREAVAGSPTSTPTSTPTSGSTPGQSTDSGWGPPGAALAGYGVGLVGGAAFAIFYGLASSQFATVMQRCSSGTCARSDVGLLDTGESYQTMVNVSLVVALVGVVAGTVIWVAMPRRPTAH